MVGYTLLTVGAKQNAKNFKETKKHKIGISNQENFLQDKFVLK